MGFNSFIRYRFTSDGTHYVGVSNWFNDKYDPISGNGDTVGWQRAVGNYKLIVGTTAVN